MRQFVGSVRRRDDGARPAAVGARRRGSGRPRPSVDAAELAMMEADDEATQLRYAQALADWADAGGYDAEVLWDVCYHGRARRAVRPGASAARSHAVRRRAEAARAGGAAARAGRGAAARRAGQLPRRARQALAGGAARRVARRPCCFVSHDRELLARTATRIVTVELGAGGQPRRGSTAAASRPTTRRAATGSRGSRSCAGAGTRSTPSCGRWC